MPSISAYPAVLHQFVPRRQHRFTRQHYAVAATESQFIIGVRALNPLTPSYPRCVYRGDIFGIDDSEWRIQICILVRGVVSKPEAELLGFCKRPPEVL